MLGPLAWGGRLGPPLAAALGGLAGEGLGDFEETHVELEEGGLDQCWRLRSGLGCPWSWRR